MKIFKAIKPSSILSTFFSSFIIFLISLLWIRYFISSFYLALFLAMLISLIIGIVLESFKNARLKKLQNIKLKDGKYLKYKLHFLTMNKADLNKYIACCLKDYKTQIKSNQFIISGNNFNILVLNLISAHEYVTTDVIIKEFSKINLDNVKRLIILTNSYSSLCQDVCSYITNLSDVHILDFDESYKLILEKNIENLAAKEICVNIKEHNYVNNIISLTLNKKKAKSYFFASLFLLITSFFLPYNLYYKIFSTILLVLCLLSSLDIQYFHKYKPKSILND